MHATNRYAFYTPFTTWHNGKGSNKNDDDDDINKINNKKKATERKTNQLHCPADKQSPTRKRRYFIFCGVSVREFWRLYRIHRSFVRSFTRALVCSTLSLSLYG